MLHEGHRTAFTQAEKDKVVVDGAKIVCSYAKDSRTGKNPYVYLRIPCEHGLREEASVRTRKNLCADREYPCVPELQLAILWEYVELPECLGQPGSASPVCGPDV